MTLLFNIQSPNLLSFWLSRWIYVIIITLVLDYSTHGKTVLGYSFYFISYTGTLFSLIDALYGDMALRFSHIYTIYHNWLYYFYIFWKKLTRSLNRHSNTHLCKYNNSSPVIAHNLFQLSNDYFHYISLPLVTFWYV